MEVSLTLASEVNCQGQVIDFVLCKISDLES